MRTGTLVGPRVKCPLSLSYFYPNWIAMTNFICLLNTKFSENPFSGFRFVTCGEAERQLFDKNTPKVKNDVSEIPERDGIFKFH
jgi:hypothetical protein